MIWNNQREIERVQQEIEILQSQKRSTERLKIVLDVMWRLNEAHVNINRNRIETYIDEMQNAQDYKNIQNWINLYRRNHERIQKIEWWNNASKENIVALKNAQKMFRNRINELLDRSEHINKASIDAMLDAIDQGETPQVPKYDNVVSIKTAQEGNEQYFEESIPWFNLFKYKRVNLPYQLWKYIRVELIWQSGNHPEEKALVWLKTPAENNGIPKILHRGFQLFNNKTREYEDWSSNFKAQENSQEETISMKERVLTDREWAEIGLLFKEAKEKKRISVWWKDWEENMKLDLHIAWFWYFKITHIFPTPENAVGKPLESRGYSRVQISYQYTDDIEMHTDVVIYIHFPISEWEKLDIAEAFLWKKTEKQVNGNNKIDKELVTRWVIQKINITTAPYIEKDLKELGNTVSPTFNQDWKTKNPDQKASITEKEKPPKWGKKWLFEDISSLLSRAWNGIKKFFWRKE